LPSWPARLGLPQLAIDHVFVSSGIGVLADQRILPNSGSDHQPIAIEIAIPRN
jgi:endonuclease/exonuclease/phosphatase family metal-dependent hydrolase